MLKLLGVLEEDLAAVTQSVKSALEFNRKKDQDIRMHERLQAIYLLLLGMTISEVVLIINRSQATVYNFIEDFRTAGIEGLLMDTSPGRDTKLFKFQEEILIQVLETKTPIEVGFEIERNWTSRLVQKWIETEFGIKYSDRGVRNLLNRLGFSFTKPTYHLAKADPVKKALFRHAFEEAWKRLLDDKIDHIFFLDECTIRDYQALQKTWCKTGEQKSIPTFGKHHSIKITATLDYESGETFSMDSEKFTHVEFQRFLELLMKKYPDKKMVIILDNSNVHHAQELNEFLEKHQKNIELLFLPPYSPDLNMIEELWKWVQETVINNVFYDKAMKLSAAVKRFFNHINKKTEITREKLCNQYDPIYRPESELTF
jgi:transposase